MGSSFLNMPPESATRIYALIDPRDQSVRYVGKTRQSLKGRLNGHVHDYHRKNNPCANWLKKLIRMGMSPIISLLEEVPTEIWQEAEQFWIAYFRSIGARLTNSTSGGDKDCEFTPELRKRLSEAHKGQRAWNKGLPASPESIARLAAGRQGKPHPMLGKKHSPETLIKLRASHMGQSPANKGHKASLEVRKKISLAHMGQSAWNKGMKMSAEHCAKLSAAHMGKPNLSKGKKRSPEVGSKISAAKKGKPNPNKGKKYKRHALISDAVIQLSLL